MLHALTCRCTSVVFDVTACVKSCVKSCVTWCVMPITHLMFPPIYTLCSAFVAINDVVEVVKCVSLCTLDEMSYNVHGWWHAIGCFSMFNDIRSSCLVVLNGNSWRHGTYPKNAIDCMIFNVRGWWRAITCIVHGTWRSDVLLLSTALPGCAVTLNFWMGRAMQPIQLSSKRWI